MKKVQLGMLIALLTILLTGCGVTRINPGHVGIKVDMAGSQRGVQDYTLRTGWVFYNPLGSQIVEYPTFVQTAVWTKNPNEGRKEDESITFTTKDDMVVNADVSLSYHLDTKKVPDFYVQFRSDDLSAFTYGFLHNVARDKFNEIGGQYTVEQIMGDNGPFLKNVETALQAQVAPYGVSIDQFGFVGAPRPPQQVIEAINAKVQATQLALQKENEVAQAQADAQKQVAEAEGRAKALLTVATAEAEANHKVSESLTPELLQHEAIQKWNGSQPQVLGTGGGLLFNIPVQGGRK